MVAAIRPDDWNLFLFLHVLGAMLLLGALTLAAVSLAAAWRDGTLASTRLGYRALLLAAIPGWLLMRIFGEVIAAKEKLGDLPTDPTWLTIGYITSEPGLLLLIVATVLAGLRMRRSRRGEGGGPGLDRAATLLVGVMLVAYVVALWAMTTKPT